MRALAFIEGGEQKLFSRNGRNVTSQFPKLADLPKQVKSSPFVLDGEIVCLDDDNHPNFSRVRQRLQAKRLGLKQRNPVNYIAFTRLNEGRIRSAIESRLMQFSQAKPYSHAYQVYLDYGAWVKVRRDYVRLG